MMPIAHSTGQAFEPDRSDRTRARPALDWWFALAIGFALLLSGLAMRGAAATSPWYPDAARHALNGALVLDMLREGGWTQPRTFAEAYYDHLPAISIPYHPPLFPLFESAIFAIFGVSTFSARLAVGLSVFVAFLLVFAVGRVAGLTALASLAGTLVSLALPMSRMLAADVMLEFPSLVMLAATVLLIQRSLARGAPYVGLALAGVCAAAAVCTKQTTVFVIGVPVCVMLVRRNWSLLRSWRFWFFHMLASVAFVAVVAAAKLAGFAGNSRWSHFSLIERVQHHAWFYAEAFSLILRPLVATLCVAGLAIIVLLRIRGGARKLDVLLAWILTSVGCLLIIPPWDARYLFYTFIPLALLMMHLISDRLAAARAPSPLAVLLIALAVAAVTVRGHSQTHMHGVDAAARYVADQRPNRVLIFSVAHNGAFTFEFRARQPQRHTYILRGHGLAAEYLESAAFFSLLHEYGIDHVVIDDDGRNDEPKAILDFRDSRLIHLAAIPTRIASERPGTIHILRFTDPSQHPRPVFRAPSRIRNNTKTD
jgi:hypothetical protein